MIERETRKYELEVDRASRPPRLQARLPDPLGRLRRRRRDGARGRHPRDDARRRHRADAAGQLRPLLPARRAGPRTGTIRGVRDGRVLVNPAYAPDLCLVYLSHIFMLPEARGTVLTYWLRIAPLDLAVSYLHVLHQPGKIALPAPDAPGKLLRHARRPRGRDGVLQPRGPALAAAHPVLRPRRLRRASTRATSPTASRTSATPELIARDRRPAGAVHAAAAPRRPRARGAAADRRGARRDASSSTMTSRPSASRSTSPASLDVVLGRLEERRAQGKNDVALLPLPTGAHNLKRLKPALPLRRLPAPLRTRARRPTRCSSGRSRRRSRRTRTGSTRSSRTSRRSSRRRRAGSTRAATRASTPTLPTRRRATPAAGGTGMNDASNVKPIISIENVTKRYGDFVAVHDASFEIRAAEFFSMLGPSGCGKTTMLRMIAGFEEVTSGVLRLDGVDVVGVPPYRRAVNTVFQNYALFPHLSVFDNVAFGPRIRSQDERRARATRARDARRRAPRRLRPAQAEPALRRPAPARRARARARERPERAAARRAALRARPRAPPPDAVRAQAHPARRRHHLRVRDARPGGGAHDVRPHRRDARRGTLEQVGTPEQIYDEPATAFVARFIGSANLIPVTVERAAGGRATVSLPGGRTGDVGDRRARSSRPATRRVLMIRPERTRARGERADRRPRRHSGDGHRRRLPGRAASAARCATRSATRSWTYLEAQRPEPVRPAARCGSAGSRTRRACCTRTRRRFPPPPRPLRCQDRTRAPSLDFARLRLAARRPSAGLLELDAHARDELRVEAAAAVHARPACSTGTSPSRSA